MTQRRVVLRDVRDAQGVQHLDARLDGGGVVLEGQDLGPGVSEAFGSGVREYEWTQRIPAEHVPRLVAALGGPPGGDVLELLAARFSGSASYDLSRWLHEQGIPAQLWSRVGD